LSIKVDVRNGNLEQALRVLKKKVMKEGGIKDYRLNSVYEKPSEKKRRKKKEGIANYKKTQKKIKTAFRYIIK
jgi:small subunit ribosomal protein S21